LPTAPDLASFVAQKTGQEIATAEPAPQQNNKIAFSQQNQPLPPDQCSEMVRKMLRSRKPGMLDEFGRTHFEQIVMALISTAVNPRSPFHVQASALLFDRAFGKVKPSEAELGAIKEGGARFVLVQAQDIKPAEKKKLKAPSPEFVEGEVVENGSE